MFDINKLLHGWLVYNFYYALEKYCQISRAQEQTKPVKENLTRKNCSSYRRVRPVGELVKKLVKENLLVCAGLKKRLLHIRLI